MKQSNTDNENETDIGGQNGYGYGDKESVIKNGGGDLPESSASGQQVVGSTSASTPDASSSQVVDQHSSQIPHSALNSCCRCHSNLRVQQPRT